MEGGKNVFRGEVNKPVVGKYQVLGSTKRRAQSER